MKDFLYKVLSGFFLGISVLAPGISGSIIAIMMGIYEDILDIFAHPTKNIKRNLLFCLPLGIGVVISAVAFIFAFDWMFSTFEQATFFLFVGLILGTIPIVLREVLKHGINLWGIVGLVIAAVITFVLSIAVGIQGVGETHASFDLTYFEAIYGGLATGASMLIPGMSVSVILMLLGIYKDLLFAVRDIMTGDVHLVPYILVFAAFALAGVVLISRFIKRAFVQIPHIAYHVVLGFILGSLVGIAINSFQIADPDSTVLISALAFMGGAAISLAFSWASARREDKEAIREAKKEALSATEADKFAEKLADNKKDKVGANPKNKAEGSPRD